MQYKVNREGWIVSDYDACRTVSIGSSVDHEQCLDLILAKSRAEQRCNVREFPKELRGRDL